MTPTLQPILKQLKQDLTELYSDRLINLTLFGSQARGDSESDSDIDVLVVLRSRYYELSSRSRLLERSPPSTNWNIRDSSRRLLWCRKNRSALAFTMNP
ncbi:MAG: nucleotidyltransferase domain-containing protein [Synechococcales cyanobacterium C42_A2020_086]|nr:nucleotidyltransferase domain-containing protein [Synechococcales cyanobacterium M58_A2018_015]MBF2074854.1 nucleotidyltransferase domain-containing protein [Synechococcales cyanobacterium C42_A2020_086]